MAAYAPTTSTEFIPAETTLDTLSSALSPELLADFASLSATHGEDPATWDGDRWARALGLISDSTPPHRQFRQKAHIASPALRETLAAIAAEVLASQRPATRDHTAETKAKIAANVDLLVANLVAAAAINPSLAVALPSRAEWFSRPAEPRNPILSRRTTIDGARDGLIALGLAELVREGSPMGGTHTLIRATPLLLDRTRRADADCAAPIVLELHHDSIILRSKKRGKGAAAGGSLIRFDNTPDTVAMRKRITIINEANRPGRVTLPGLSPQEAEALLDHLTNKTSRRADAAPNAVGIAAWMTETQLHRVFNNGTFNEGGRFYGASWQRLPQKTLGLRRKIRIDGEAVVELDFKALAPRMAFHVLARMEAPDDPYLLLPVPRSIAKTSLNALLNMDQGIGRPYSGYNDEAAGMAWPALVEAARRCLPDIAECFGSGIGLALQRRDSDIAEAVMLKFAERDIPCLGIHDSFIVQERHADELREVMMAVYLDQTGYEARISVG
jgi:hypothetical protein